MKNSRKSTHADNFNCVSREDSFSPVLEDYCFLSNYCSSLTTIYCKYIFIFVSWTCEIDISVRHNVTWAKESVLANLPPLSSSPKTSNITLSTSEYTAGDTFVFRTTTHKSAFSRYYLYLPADSHKTICVVKLLFSS